MSVLLFGAIAVPLLIVAVGWAIFLFVVVRGKGRHTSTSAPMIIYLTWAFLGALSAAAAAMILWIAWSGGS